MKSINMLMAALVCELIQNDIPHPLAQSFPLFCLWDDLCRLAGEPVPPAVAGLLDAPAALCLTAVPPAFHVALAEPERVAELEPA